MREILFRGKDIDNGKWIYGGYVHLHKTTYCYAGSDDGNNDIHKIVFERMTDWNLPNKYMMADVLPETVGQYTGLTDNNGTKIFEGDILVGFLDEEYPEHETVAVVEWRKCMWVTHQRNCHPDLLEESDMDWFEVIGNIHDNPELLKGMVRNEETNIKEKAEREEA